MDRNVLIGLSGLAMMLVVTLGYIAYAIYFGVVA